MEDDIDDLGDDDGELGGHSSASSSSRRRRRGRSKKLIGRQPKVPRASKADVTQHSILETGEESKDVSVVSDFSLGDISDMSISIMSASNVETSDMDKSECSAPSPSITKKKKKKSAKIGRIFKKKSKSHELQGTSDSVQASASGGVSDTGTVPESDSVETRENQSESNEIGLWSALNYILNPSEAATNEAPSERSLAVEDATESLINEAVNEEFSADVSLLDDVHPSIEEVIDFDHTDPHLESAADDENPFIFQSSFDEGDDAAILESSGLTSLEIIRLNLLLLLPTDWSVDISMETVRLTHLSPYEIPMVQKAITWKDGVIRIFVHNLEVPENNYLRNAAKIEDPLNLGEVCDYLCRLANLLLSSNICQGVKGYKEHWPDAEERMSNCFLEKNFQETECLRHRECALVLIASSVCYSCSKLKTNLKNMAWRRKLKKDGKRINNRYMNKEELSLKVSRIQIEKRKKDKELAKLRERVRRLVTKQSISVAQDLSDDLATVFSENLSSMTEVQKLFWTEQVKAMARGKNIRTIRWNPFVIKLALHLQMISPAGYKYLKNFIKLPSERTLYDFTHVVDAKEGAQDFIIGDLQKELESKPREEHEKYFNLLFDEVSVRSDIVMKKSTGEIIGYTNLTSFESEMESVQAQISQTEFKLKPATKVLVYMLQGVTNDIRGIVGIYATEALTAAQLFTRTWDIIYRLESSNLKVLSLICDGAPTNKKFFRMHASHDKDVNVVYKTLNLAAVGEVRYIFFIVDPPHLLKSLRNCLANSYSHKGTKCLWKNKEDLSWKVIEMIYLITLEDKYKSVKLTRAHVYLTSYSCMKVIYAAQVVSNSVAAAIQRLKSDPRLQKYHVDELCQFLRHVNNFFDCVNGAKDSSSARNRDNKFLAPYESLNDWRFDYLHKEVLGFFLDWKNDVTIRKGKFTKDARDKMFISHESYESLKVTIHAFIGATKYILSVGAPSVDGRRFNQDKLEQYFGLLRMAGGGSDNPSVQEVIRKSISLHQQGKAARPSSKGNTEVATGSWVPDQRPLAKRGKID